ncbi:hypothetical protein TanjilG_30802 [Lupinus angustifolius]|uniref:HSF-type DNA-binding domain-containing protein n=1 Tax=Lupinus angustifolius TaxID=3871 RepID=A0A394DN14_LUPAN|nr:PREDICTED: heat stress transcription factor A-6b-like [Lupinus angustifolius]OIW21201.1 hypothetical protein TanjilG_30802 [Lupinus angustifolius]
MDQMKEFLGEVVPQPMEGLHESGPPPFLTKTYDIVEDVSTNQIISWSVGNNSFVVWDHQAFSISLLPRYFKHNNFSSFVRQLNTYGFRKVDPDKWEFANEGFLRGQRHLLKNIRRKKTTQPQTPQHALAPCLEVGKFGLDFEIDRLKRDKQILMVEVVKLRQQHQNTRNTLQEMESRLQKTEQKQQHMMKFLARAMKNPNFMQQWVQQKELEEDISKKRRLNIDQGMSSDIVNVEVAELGYAHHEECSAFVKLEEQEYTDILGLEVSDLDLAMDIKEQSGSQRNIDEKGIELESRDKGIDEAFWEDFLNEGTQENLVGFNNVADEDIDVLVQEFDYLA